VPSFELERLTTRDAACLLARILATPAVAGADGEWDEWQTLLLEEHRSLHGCRGIAWEIAGRSLARLADPCAAWVRTARALQPLFRARMREHSSEVDPLVHLVMPAMYASMLTTSGRQQLWSSAFELARRQFLVDRKPASEFGYWLCAEVFAVAPLVLVDGDALERAIELLPTAAHVHRAREQISQSSS
jgi:hypothetical protein